MFIKRTICLILGVASFGFAAFLFWSTLVQQIVPRTFESTAKILVRGPNPNSAGWSIESDIQLLQSAATLSQVITNLDLAKRWGEKYKEDALRLDTTRLLLQRQLNILSPENTRIIEIRAQSDDPYEAMAIANAIAKTGMKQLSNLESEEGTIKTNRLALIAEAKPGLRPVRPSRFQKIAHPIGGFAAIIAGVAFLLWASMIPKRPSPPPTPS